MIKALRSSHRVLVVEDNPVHIREVELILRSLGLECLVVRTQAEAEAVLQRVVAGEEVICLMFLDLALPVLDAAETFGPETGLVLLQRTRGHFGLDRRTLPVIVTTAYSHRGINTALAYNAGANGYLAKPLRLPQPQNPEETITRWLAECCEVNHRTCPSTRGGAVPRPSPRRTRKPEHEYRTNHYVHLSGTKLGDRHAVEIDGTAFPFRAQWVELLYRLAEEDRKPGPGYVATVRLGVSTPRNAISLLKKELRQIGFPDLIETDGGRHRLTCPPENVTLNEAVLRDQFSHLFRPPAPAAPTPPRRLS